MSSSFSLDNLIDHITWLNTCKAGTFLLGAHMLHIGVWAFVSPRSLTKAFGLRSDGQMFSATSANKPNSGTSNTKPTPASDETKPVENFWPYLFAPREVGFGLLVLAFAGLGEWRAASMVVGVVAGLLATVDGAVSGIYAEGGWPDAVKSHFVPGAILGAMAVVLARG